MLYTKEFDIRSFKFWSGGEDHINELREAHLLDEAEKALESIFAGNENLPSDTDINDLVWHDFNYLLEIMEVAYCENCNRLFSVNDDRAIKTDAELLFCSPSCLDSHLSGLKDLESIFSIEEIELLQNEGIFSLVEELFPNENINMDFLESQENLTTDEQIAVDLFIKVISSL